tara:strand:+ start:7631 stop:9430 length:1800 start_codon:yes stop_codon:yes gene_type:complete
METIYINAQWPEELRVASIRDGKLFDLEIEIANANRNKGNIYNAKILKIETSLNAVFVDYGQNKNGFLPIKEIHHGYLKKDDQGKPDTHSLKVGQKLLVQVEKDERGEKGAALTTYISLAGTYLVFMPFSSKSSAITKQAEAHERAELKTILDSFDIDDGAGIIVRTAGIGKTKNDLLWDFESLKTHWNTIVDASHQNPAPSLIYQEANTMIRALRDNLRLETEKIIVDEKKAYEQLKTFISNIRPQLIDKIELNDSSLPLFTQYDLEDKIKTIYEREIRLESGGAIIIDTTEALTSIDVNSARSTKSVDIESTALHTNLQAVEEIAHQLRLRDIGGIVVIDFIDMSDKKNRSIVEDKAREVFSHDRAKIKNEPISSLTGCMSLLRQRLRSSANSIMTFKNVCNIDNLSFHLMRLAQSIAAEAQVRVIQLQVSVDIGTFLLNECREIINRISKVSQAEIQIIPNPNFDQTKFAIKSIRGAQTQTEKSYELKEEIEIPLPESSKQRFQVSTPVVQQDLYKNPAPVSKGLLYRLFFFLNVFSSKTEKIKKIQKTKHRTSSSNVHHLNKKSPRKGSRTGDRMRRKRGGLNRKRGKINTDQGE